MCVSNETEADMERIQKQQTHLGVEADVLPGYTHLHKHLWGCLGDAAGNQGEDLSRLKRGPRL